MSALRKVAAAVLTVALLAGAMWLYTRKAHLKGDALHPLPSHGRIGAVVATRDFSVKIGRVDVAAAIQKPGFPKPVVMKALGLFVIVSADVRSEWRPYRLGNARLVTHGGVSYDESGRTELPTSNGGYEPMLWTPATYIFEIPRDRLAGLRFVIGTADLLNQLSGQTDIDLGIDGDRAAQLRAHPASTYVLKTR